MCRLAPCLVHSLGSTTVIGVTDSVLVDGWVGGWMDGWVNRWMDRWMDGWMDARTPSVCVDWFRVWFTEVYNSYRRY